MATSKSTVTATTKYTPYDVSKDYAKAEEAYKKAQQAAYDSQKSDIDFQKKQLAQDYRTQRGDIYKNARISAIGNNEALAARGLAGNAYQNPRSGASETARINENVALRNSLNAAGRQEQSQKDALAQQLISAGYTRDINIAEYMAELALKRSEAMRQENQFATSFNYQAGRDKVADDQWQKTYDYNKYVDDRNYNYQVGRDKVTDSQWQKTYDYNKYVDDRNYNYQVGRDKVTDSQWQKAFDYQASRDKITDSQWQKEFDLAVKDGDYNKALNMAQTLAAAGDFSGYKKLGYSTSQINAMKKAYNATGAAAKSSSGGSRTASRSSTTKSSKGKSSSSGGTGSTANLEEQLRTVAKYGGENLERRAAELIDKALMAGEISRTQANKYLDRMDPTGTIGRY